MLDANAILDTDPDWLSTHSGWFKRHGIRILAGACGYPAPVKKAVVSRLASLGAGTELIIDNPSGDCVTDAAKAGVTLIAPDRIRVFAAGTKVERSGSGIEILAGDWHSWDTLYSDISAAWLDEVPGRIVGPGNPPLPSHGSPNITSKHRWISLHGIGDPARAVAERPGLLEHFDGVVLDSAWLEARSQEALAKDRAFFEKEKLSVAIDFSRSINNFPDLTFANIVPHRREASQRIFDAVLQKMPLLGAKCAIAVHHSVETGNWENQKEGVEQFLNKANSLGITVNWRTSAFRPPRGIEAQAAWVADLKTRHPNLRIAACTVDEPDADKLLKSIAPAGSPELWLVAAPVPPKIGRTGMQFLPLANFNPPELQHIMAASKNATVVFDADYLSWQEALADLKH